jgi:hypothetical protein
MMISKLVNTCYRLMGYTFYVRRVNRHRITTFTDLTFTQANDKFYELANGCNWDSIEIIQDRKGKTKVVQSVRF